MATRTNPILASIVESVERADRKLAEEIRQNGGKLPKRVPLPDNPSPIELLQRRSIANDRITGVSGPCGE